MGNVALRFRLIFKAAVMKFTHPQRIAYCLFCSLALTGCDDRPAAPAKEKRASIAVQSAQKNVSGERWKAALIATYAESSTSDRNTGVKRFFATFRRAPGNIAPTSFALRDAFRKVWIFHAGPPPKSNTSVYVYVSVPDQGQPVFFLQPIYRAEGEFILLKKVSMLVDGELVLDLDCGKVRREVVRHTIAMEYCDLPLSAAQVETMRALKPDAKVLVRLTGKDGYVHLDPLAEPGEDPLARFKRDVQSALYYFDVISAAVEPHVAAGQPAGVQSRDMLDSLVMPNEW